MTHNELLYLITGLIGGFFFRHFLHDFLKEEVPLPQEVEMAVAAQEAAAKEINVRKVFRASRLGDPITPDEVIFDAKGVTFNVKSLFKSTESFVLYSDISGVEVVESLLLATIKVKPKIRAEIKIDNFAKDDAKTIKTLIKDRLS
jgi:hypothetical protein